MRIAPGISSLVGGAVALAQAGQPACGFAALEENPRQQGCELLALLAARGHLLQSLNRKDEAHEAFTRAASLTEIKLCVSYLFKRPAEAM